MRLTAKPRYLLLLHRGKEKSNTVTALMPTSRIFSTPPFIVTTFILSFVCEVKFLKYFINEGTILTPTGFGILIPF